MNNPVFGMYRLPTVTPHSMYGGEPQRWFVFRIREQMYVMVYFGTSRKLFLEKVKEDMEQSYDEWCHHPELKDPRFTYIRLTPHPTDDTLQGLLDHGRDRSSTSSSERELDFLKRHGAGDVLEALDP